MTLANTSPVVSTLEVSPQVVPKEKVEHRVSFFQDGQSLTRPAVVKSFFASFLSS